MPVFYLNPIIGACLCIAIIFIDYCRKFNSDRFKRVLFLWVLVCAFISVAASFISGVLQGAEGKHIGEILYISNTLFLLGQNAANYFLVVFLDYILRNDSKKAKKLLTFTVIWLAVFAVTAALNIRFHFFFSISEQNRYVRGSFYFLRLIVSYAPILLILGDALFARKLALRSHVAMIVLLSALSALGSGIDVAMQQGGLMWSCFAASLLYIYFFMVQNDLRIDPLTGIGNRLAFNEFIGKLSHQVRIQNYYVVMIDIDHFKEINDTLGHVEGDNALRDMALILKNTTRRSDFIFRFGGDEFVIAVKAEYNVDRIMERIEQAILAQNKLETRAYSLEISYGLAVYPTNSPESITDFITRIDRLMYEHKTSKNGAV